MCDQQCYDRGMPDCQSGAVHSLGCGTIIYMAVAGDIGVCNADCHEGNCRKALCDQGCSSVSPHFSQPCALGRFDGRRSSQVAQAADSADFGQAPASALEQGA
ncbi:UNVERIFIED_CONTAM: hypothetical protein O1L33_28700, partial [Pseudomonas aeruginosa]